MTQATTAPVQDAQARATARLLERYEGEIRRRGGEVVIESKDRTHRLQLVERRRIGGASLVLLRASGWRYYSSRYGHARATLAYLCGRDDAGLWAARVPGTCMSVRESLDWLTPAEVRRARASSPKRIVLRQGDVYAIETMPVHDAPSGPVGEARRDWRAEGSPWVHTHQWDAATRTLTHTPMTGEAAHEPLCIPYPARFVMQRTYGMGRGAGLGDAD